MSGTASLRVEVMVPAKNESLPAYPLRSCCFRLHSAAAVCSVLLLSSFSGSVLSGVLLSMNQDEQRR